MKNLKLLPLLSIIICTLLSFTNFDENDTIKDGTYNAKYSIMSRRDLGGFQNGHASIDVTVKIENGVTQEISSKRNLDLNADELLYLPLNFDSKGNAFVEATSYDQNVYNKRDQGRFYLYKLKISKKELNKELSKELSK
jgi:hypothetical protein